ncbi:MAG: hypothetical protein M9962_05740 [Oligoflexia bacterium]|nr:hypothetical protein [Oligoflexia bacterium]
MTRFSSEIENSIQYLASEEARKSLEVDAYWPKWHSPWWHMLLLHEMGEGKKIPTNTIQWFIDAVNRYPVKIFPIYSGEMPEGLDPYRASPCHCQLGNVYQVLAGYGIDVDKELPWIRPWLLRYQMQDGGMNCDCDAYLVQDECPSSMVGTISAFEAILFCTPHAWTNEEKNFLNKAAHFLMERKLMNGSQTKYNAEEREEAKAWLKPCFPRFYLYDVLRGLHALLSWADKSGETVPSNAISDVVKYLKTHFSDDVILNERQSYKGVGTILKNAEGEWIRRQPATFFPLLNKTSVLGIESPFLTMQWRKIKEKL